MRYSVSEANFSSEFQYDAAIVSLGYEYRSSQLIRSGLSARRILAVTFNELQVFSYDENLRICQSAGCEIRNSADDSIDELINEIVAPMSGVDVLHFAIDISSMTRKRLASTLIAFRNEAARHASGAIIDYYYNIPEYYPPPKILESNLSAGPIRKEFAGVLRPASIPVGAVFGLGYEAQRAFGAFELLEPNRAWALRPQSIDPRFDNAVLSANQQLLEILSSSQDLQYELTDPVDLIYSLDSLVYSLQSQFRLVLIPMGPKIFTLACLILGLSDELARPAVWRVGVTNNRHPSNVAGTDQVIGLRIEFPGTEPSSPIE